MSEETGLILLNGRVVGETEYEMTVTGLPNVEVARAFAQKLAIAAAGVLAEVMGGPPQGVAAIGSGASDEVKAGIAKAGGVPLTPMADLPEVVKGLMAELSKDDCQCSGCVARRAHEALLASGSNSDAKH